ncbi:uncharacterized protein LOC115447673 [Manduca sexta]|uniref:uncharacterized protein LOC115447673 n=1 Tax=Manduca sexta TaxID=7130 RepID=UPI0018904C69|nr:uncharacterized protein LOC115447673 [Manduca sexta]
MAIGKIGPFDLHKDNWVTYADRLEQYFIANAVKDEIKVATLITLIGNEAYDLMVNLCTPNKPSSMTYDTLVELMKKHLNPKPSLLAERFKFRQRIQKSEENIANYVAELKKLSKDCGFMANGLTENLRDQFVCGLLNDDIRQKLFTEDDTISFDRAYTIAVSMEAAETNAALVEDCTRGKSGNGDSIPAAKTTSVHHGRPIKGGSGRRGATGTWATRDSPVTTSRSGKSGEYGEKRGGGAYFSRNNNSNQICNVCGREHEANTCKFKMYVCRICNREGHLKKMCPKVKGKTSMHNIEEEVALKNMVESDSDEFQIL